VMRSLLFVPADAPAKLDKAAGSGADALIIDLEDSVAPANLPAAASPATSPRALTPIRPMSSS